jgi:hypothetical protein
MPPTLRGPAKPRRSATALLERGARDGPPMPPTLRGPAKPCRSATALLERGARDGPLSDGYDASVAAPSSRVSRSARSM